MSILTEHRSRYGLINRILRPTFYKTSVLSKKLLEFTDFDQSILLFQRILYICVLSNNTSLKISSQAPRCKLHKVPNRIVAVDAWMRSACYPRGSFYPLSCMPTTRHYRITNIDFRPCSTCLSRSQAGLCVCTIIPISIRNQPTFIRLRCIVGVNRPS